MADYREISQEYAQGAIKGTFLLNGGASVSVLTQISDLIQLPNASGVAAALILWAGGVTCSSLTWACGFMSTRYVDRSTEAGRDKEAELRVSDNYMFVGVLLIVLSVLLFVCGAGRLAAAMLV